MIRLIRLLLILLLVVGGVGFILFQIIKFLGLTRWSKSRREKERREGIASARSMLENPVPWQIKELDLLSLYYAFSADRGVFSTTKSGSLKTIYGEDFISFVVKQYSTSDYLLCFCHSKKCYAIFNAGRKGQVYVGDQKKYDILDSALFDLEGQRLAEISRGLNFHSVIINGKEVAHIEGSEVEVLENTRAFQLVEEDKLKESDLDVFTIIIVQFIMEQDLLRA